MSPQVTARLKLHEFDPVDELPRPRTRLRAAPAGSVAVPEHHGRATYGDGQASSALMWREALNRRLLGVADIAAALLALVITLSSFGQRRDAVAAIVSVVLLLVLFKIAGLYDRDDLRLVHSTLDEVPALAQLTGLFALGVGILHSMVFAGALAGDQIAALWVASFAAILLGRGMARGLAGRLSPFERCLVIGEPWQVDGIRAKLASSRARAHVIASLPLADESSDDSAQTNDLEAVRDVTRALNVHRIIVAPTTTDTGAVVEMIRIAKTVGVRVSVLPRIFEAVGSAVEFEDIDGMTMLGVRRFGLSRSSRRLKRSFDLLVGSVGLVIVSPILFAIVVLIRLDSRGPIFFRQVRVGRDGMHFGMFKFRSMIADAEVHKERLRALNEAGDGLFKIRDDPRVTRVGGFLRRTSLDELPQLFNVLRGEMSLVGPRPLVTDEDALVLGLDRSRLHLTPGMTGPWQVLGTRVPMQEMVAIDYLYVANWSLWRDLKVLFRTVGHVFGRGNV